MTETAILVFEVMWSFYLAGIVQYIIINSFDKEAGAKLLKGKRRLS